jgi:hypothetical protein
MSGKIHDSLHCEKKVLRYVKDFVFKRAGNLDYGLLQQRIRTQIGAVQATWFLFDEYAAETCPTVSRPIQCEGHFTEQFRDWQQQAVDNGSIFEDPYMTNGTTVDLSVAVRLQDELTNAAERRRRPHVTGIPLWFPVSDLIGAAYRLRGRRSRVSAWAFYLFDDEKFGKQQRRLLRYFIHELFDFHRRGACGPVEYLNRKFNALEERILGLRLSDDKRDLCEKEIATKLNLPYNAIHDAHKSLYRLLGCTSAAAMTSMIRYYKPTIRA